MPTVSRDAKGIIASARGRCVSVRGDLFERVRCASVSERPVSGVLCFLGSSGGTAIRLFRLACGCSIPRRGACNRAARGGREGSGLCFDADETSSLANSERVCNSSSAGCGLDVDPKNASTWAMFSAFRQHASRTRCPPKLLSAQQHLCQWWPVALRRVFLLAFASRRSSPGTCDPLPTPNASVWTQA